MQRGTWRENGVLFREVSSIQRLKCMREWLYTWGCKRVVLISFMPYISLQLTFVAAFLSHGQVVMVM